MIFFIDSKISYPTVEVGDRKEQYLPKVIIVTGSKPHIECR